MTIERWEPRRDTTKQEQFLLKRLDRVRKLFGFLRLHRQELFDDAFQAELEGMYRGTGAGKEPLVPGLMAMATLLQGYLRVSDAEAVELSIVDLRWQMVLDRLGETKPAFSQGALQNFRDRLIESDMDRRLLERTAELARRTGGFDAKKLPKTLRVAVDSSPLEGAGRVEDTINLLGHAARKVVCCAAELLGWEADEVCRKAGIPLLLAASVKKGLDLQWSDPAQKRQAVDLLAQQLLSLERWLDKRLPEEMKKPPLSESLNTLHQIIEQDLEPDPSGGGVKVCEGVAEDRRVSIEDGEMRHGRKSKSQRFNGYKRHIATDLDSGAIVAGEVTPANRPEELAMPALQADIARQGFEIAELFIDRGYISSPVVDKILGRGGEVICRPWVARNGALFSKQQFHLDLRAKTITCPAGQTQSLRLGQTVEFEPELCGACKLRERCTDADLEHGRTVSISENEALQQRLRRLAATPAGRARLRKRVPVEHRLAHLSYRQGRRARYRGARKNTYDLRRAASIQNLETAQRLAA
jgi:hypothetical protein